jgi:hypothetical protein
MFPSAFAIPAPIPLALDLTLTFGPMLLLAVLALLDISAVAVLHAAFVANRSRRAGEEIAVEPSVIHLRRGRLEKRQAAPPSRAA